MGKCLQGGAVNKAVKRWHEINNEIREREKQIKEDPNTLGVGANVEDGKILNFIYHCRAKITSKRKMTGGRHV